MLRWALVVSVQSGEPEPAAALEAKQEAKPPKGPKSVVTIPSPFKYLTSTSFKKQPPQPPPGVPTIVEPPEEVGTHPLWPAPSLPCHVMSCHVDSVPSKDLLNMNSGSGLGVPGDSVWMLALS